MPTIQARVDDETVAALERIRASLGLSTQTETLRLLIHLQDKRLTLLREHPLGASSPVSVSPLVFAPPIFPGVGKSPSAKVEDMEPPPEVGIVRRDEPVEDPLQVLRIRCAHAKIGSNTWDGVLVHLDEMFNEECADVKLAQTVIKLLREKRMPNIPLWLTEYAESGS